MNVLRKIEFKDMVELCAEATEQPRIRLDITYRKFDTDCPPAALRIWNEWAHKQFIPDGTTVTPCLQLFSPHDLAIDYWARTHDGIPAGPYDIAIYEGDTIEPVLGWQFCDHYQLQAHLSADQSIITVCLHKNIMVGLVNGWGGGLILAPGRTVNGGQKFIEYDRLTPGN